MIGGMARSVARRTTVTVGVAGAAILALALVVFLQTRDGPSDPETVQADDPRIVRADSHVVQQGDEGAPVLVEFLDFECEACASLYPVVEDLRAEYGTDLTYVVRYLPLPSHPNSRQAAHAAEAAARQGEFEAMYQRLFEAQGEWSHQQADQSAVFRGYAEELGLDLAQYDRDVASDEVADRVEADFQDALDLGLSGTPSLFLDGAVLQPRTIADLENAVDRALAQ